MTRLGASLLAAWAAASLAAAPVFAQDDTGADAAAESAGDIVVTGVVEKPPRREVNRLARDVARVGDIYDDPLARFEDRLCPGVMGLDRDYATMVIDRIRYNLERLELRPHEDDGTCHPNLIVAFVRNGQAALAALEREHGYLFKTLTLDERRELLAEDGPARVWSITQLRTRDGMPIERSENLVNPPVVSMWMAHSKIYTSTREDIVSVVVVFDLEQVVGKTLTQLADYATMRGLAETREVEGEPAIDTILGLFSAAGEPPSELTLFDQAYLRSLYDWIPNLPAATKLLGVNRQLGEMIEEQTEVRE
jgi:hypothetical protein